MEIMITEVRLKMILVDLYEKIYKLKYPAIEAHNTVELIKSVLNPEYKMDVKI